MKIEEFKKVIGKNDEKSKKVCNKGMLEQKTINVTKRRNVRNYMKRLSKKIIITNKYAIKFQWQSRLLLLLLLLLFYYYYYYYL